MLFYNNGDWFHHNQSDENILSEMNWILTELFETHSLWYVKETSHPDWGVGYLVDHMNEYHMVGHWWQRVIHDGVTIVDRCHIPQLVNKYVEL
jgi:hypothetical protein